MPRIFRLGSYWVYFWTNENKPLEPIHVHISSGSPTANATKVWITKKREMLFVPRWIKDSGKTLMCNSI